MRSGKLVDLDNLRPEDIDLADVALGLGVPRFGGQALFPDGSHYTVAQHAVLLSQFMAGVGYPQSVVDAALLHDAAEAYVGDMHGPLKHMPYMRRFSDLEDRILDVIHARLGHVTQLGFDGAVSYWDKTLLATELDCFWPDLREQYPELPCFGDVCSTIAVVLTPMTPVEASALWLREVVQLAARNGASL